MVAFQGSCFCSFSVFFLTIFISSFYFRGFFPSHLCLSLYLNMRFLTEWVFSGREQGLPTDGLRLSLA